MKTITYAVLALILSACGAQTSATSSTLMIPKCSAFAFTDSNFKVSGFSDSRVSKACKTGQEFRGLYVVTVPDAPTAPTLCGFWVIDQKLVTLDYKEMPAVDMSQYSLCGN